MIEKKKGIMSYFEIDCFRRLRIFKIKDSGERIYKCLNWNFEDSKILTKALEFFNSPGK